MKLRICWLYLTFLTLVVIPPFIGWHIRESRNSELPQRLTDTAEALKQKNNIDGAIGVYDFLIEHGLDEDQRAAEAKAALELQKNSTFTKVKDFARGLVLGDIENSSSLIGCVSGDLTLWGDFRDFVKGSYKYATGQEVDKFVMTLASIGMASTILPNVDIGISICKNFAKFMSKEVRAFFGGLIEEAVKLQKFEKVELVMGRLGKLYLRIGTGIVDIMQLARDSKELVRLMEIIEKNGKSAYGFIMLGGRQGLRFLETATDFGLNFTGATGKKILSFGLRYPQIGSRFLKITKKVGWDHLNVSLIAGAEFLGSIPLRLTLLAGLILWSWVHLFDFFSLIGVLIFPRKLLVQPAA